MRRRASTLLAVCTITILLALSATLSAVAQLDSGSESLLSPPLVQAPRLQQQNASAITVLITDQGPEPAEVTILPGDTVTWINQTGETQTLVGATGLRIFLPLVLRGVSTGAAGAVYDEETLVRECMAHGFWTQVRAIGALASRRAASTTAPLTRQDTTHSPSPADPVGWGGWS